MRKLFIVLWVLVLASSISLAEDDQSQSRLNGQLGAGVPSIKFDEQTIKAMQNQTNNTFGKVASPQEEQNFSGPYAREDESSQTAGDLQQMMTGVYGQAIKAQTNMGQGEGSSQEIDLDYKNIQAAIENAYKQVGQQTQGSQSGN